MDEETAKIRSFTDLNAWKEGHLLVLKIYKITKAFPKDEIFGIVNQMRRCVVSVTSNIAEGFSRQSYREKVQFYYIAQGSLTELQNQLIISKDVGYFSAETFDACLNQLVKLQKILGGLIKSSKNHDS